MIPRKEGSLIFTSSVASVIHGVVPHAYRASKHAVVGLMKNLCVEMGKYGIRVNCISPYAVATPIMIKGMRMGKEDVERVYLEAGNMKGVVLKEDDVAKAALFLGSDESNFNNQCNKHGSMKKNKNHKHNTEIGHHYRSNFLVLQEDDDGYSNGDHNKTTTNHINKKTTMAKRRKTRRDNDNVRDEAQQEGRRPQLLRPFLMA
ncbi:secoisolariciresinol dehydrogenase [Senna tora]|uniref:Secoisolariciresinol dehydrogenase n=1 Tax=Senna tora TaxID=362788 RepID=A0A834TJ42_9FABA|nr:secoisolariciresinol dehydrogenase [Senna tora]